MSRQLIGLALAGILAATLAACADRDSLVHRVKNYDAGRTKQTQAVAAPQTQPEVPDQIGIAQDKAPSGPVQLSQPTTDEVDRANAPEPETADNRLAFLDWFGDSADPARVKDPVAELRKARAHTAGMPQPPKSQSPSSQQAFMISENSRLVPTFRDGLPNPNGTLPEPESEQPVLRGADITGSVTPRTKPAPKDVTTDKTAEPTDPAKDRLLQIGKQLRKTDQRYASADPDAVTATGPQGVPTRDNPVRLHVALTGAAFDDEDTAALKQIAALHRKTGRKIHIHGVSRGMAGDSETSITRVRRLHKYSKRAIAILARYGVNAADVSTSTAEQRTTGVYFGTSRPQDRDRLEFSLQ